ncbi:hypothetical protein FQA47_005925 [Oryzias melastigma]|uniref:Uncharacterized protein n=1 Tax=Oryzias melastigma TaxID=30732 RepID=A0A834FR49_ORYME|nr:hypothetical protein FQA47_005925 [Oryzias melastigma]
MTAHRELFTRHPHTRCYGRKETEKTPSNARRATLVPQAPPPNFEGYLICWSSSHMVFVCSMSTFHLLIMVLRILLFQIQLPQILVLRILLLRILVLRILVLRILLLRILVLRILVLRILLLRILVLRILLLLILYTAVTDA